MWKVALGFAVGAVIGGVIGQSQVLCMNGQCAITGSWYGGAIFGGWMVGLLVSAVAFGKTVPEVDESDARSERE